MSAPTRFLSGVATVPASQPLGNYPLPDPFHTSGNSGLDLFTYANDYTDLGNAGSRTITGTSSAFALADGVGGIGVLTPGGTTTASAMYRTAAAFKFVSGQDFWYTTRIAYSGVGTGITGYFGVIKTGGATTDSLLFKLATTGVLSLVSTVSSTATTLVSSVATMTAGTYVEVAFYYDGTDLLVYANHNVVARVAGVTIGSTGTTLTNAALTEIIQITPAATETISVDFVFVAQEVVR
ncbi:hypothetical protein UFOVP135_33 [uncultured Caudovirales phage]|uniref:Uncharacterized protein n=1 Tax=uncultured Caudovirales phage TaxID=2100421 RepID=A0A6J5LJZ5_9CAUD|nr:hypothetical protein UFOVP135_33 [uncultured Caudovirales phage]